jgi:nitroreductase
MDPTTTWPEHAQALIAAAARAPSSHNTQPWRLRITADALEVHADRSRALPVNDPGDRELTISCGAALFNARAAAARNGLEVRVETCPEPAAPDLLARILPADGAPPAPLAALAGAIPERHTHRGAMSARPLDEAMLRLLAEAAAAEHTTLRPLTTRAQRAAVARLVVEGDLAQWANPRWRRELAGWLRPRQRGDGLSVPALAAPIARLMVRHVNLGSRIAAQDRRLAEAAPLLALLTTPEDGVADWLAAGQALQRLLLVACSEGLQAGYLNQPMQVPHLREALRRLLDAGEPQLLLRLGEPAGRKPAGPVRRRPLSELTGDGPG